MIRFYLSPYQTGVAPSLPNAYGARVRIYLTGPESQHAVHGRPLKSWCLAMVNAETATHDAIQDDPTITLIPLFNDTGEYLNPADGYTVGDIAEAHRNQIAAFLENHRIPAGWIQLTTPIAQVFKRIIQILHTAKRLKDDYPELDLDTQISQIPAAQRQRILAWMQAHDIQTADIELTWTVRQVLARIVSGYGWQPINLFGLAVL